MSFDEKWNTHLYAGKRKYRAVWQWIELHLTDIHSTKTDKIWIRSMKIKMNRIWKFWQNSLAYFFYCILALWLSFSFLFFFFHFSVSTTISFHSFVLWDRAGTGKVWALKSYCFHDFHRFPAIEPQFSYDCLYSDAH